MLSLIWVAYTGQVKYAVGLRITAWLNCTWLVAPSYTGDWSEREEPNAVKWALRPQRVRTVTLASVCYASVV